MLIRTKTVLPDLIRRARPMWTDRSGHSGSGFISNHHQTHVDEETVEPLYGMQS